MLNVLISLVNQLRPPEDQVPEQGPRKGFLWSTLYDELDQLDGDVVVVLDEIDMLGADNDKLLYEFPRARKMGSLENTRVGVIGISNNHMFKDSLDPRVKSALCEYEIFFSPYDATELTEILEHYVGLVFRDDTIDDGVISLCAARATQEQGDAREALDLLETAGNIARKEDAPQVTKAHVEKAGSRVEEQRVLTIVRDQLTFQMKLALLATAFLNIDEDASPRAKNI
jgi:cell division control protein 6